MGKNAHKPPPPPQKNTEDNSSIFPKILENKSRFCTKSQKNACFYELTPENSAKQGFSMNSSEKGQSFQKYLENFSSRITRHTSKKKNSFLLPGPARTRNTAFIGISCHVRQKQGKSAVFSQVWGSSGVKNYQK